MPHLLCFGFGFSARTLASRLIATGWSVSATSRSAAGRGIVAAAGATPLPFPAAASAIDAATHILVSAPPGDEGDPVILAHRENLIRRAGQLSWAGYLSTTGVYGDRGGGPVDEESPLEPSTDRGRRRLNAEAAWLGLFRDHGLPVHIFRLAGIYGPGRNQLEAILDGSARRVIKPGQVFSRIHVDDIAGVLMASMARPHPGRAYNVCDDEPCPPQDVVAFAAELLGRPLPPAIPFEEAGLSPMARSFYAESKRVDNRRIKDELGYALAFPTYREGLTALARQVQARFA
jgi:nucleoside-diphosphate-sugar epimerase